MRWPHGHNVEAWHAPLEELFLGLRSVSQPQWRTQKTLPVARAGSREFAACEASGGRSNRASPGDSDRRTGALRLTSPQRQGASQPQSDELGHRPRSGS